MTSDPEGTVEERLAAIERRLAALEVRVGVPPEPRPAPPPVPPAAPPRPATPPLVRREPAPRRVGPEISAALVLGWGGAAALVLAAAYLVRLSIVYGWLTPERQVAAAALAGVGLVAAGLVLRVRDRTYASLLAAAGIAVLYLTVYGAHLHHRLIGAGTATGLVVAVAALSLGLHALYRAAPFVAFALAGSYTAPLLIPGEGTLLDLAIYLAVWNVVYSVYALRLPSRAVYLAALYASLLVFHAAWTAGRAEGAWEVAALFQLGQFLFFGAVVTLYSIRWRRPMEGWATGLVHAGALFLLYAIEYGILETHAPRLAPWAAAAFAALLYATWLAARAATGAGHGTSLQVVHAFGALVLLHAVWWNGTPEAWRPAVALAAAVPLCALPRLAPGLRAAWTPWWLAATLIFAFGWFCLVVSWLGSGLGGLVGRVAGDEVLVVLYPAALYFLYFRLRAAGERGVALVAAHALALVGSALLVDRWLGGPDTTVERLWLSVAWGALAVGFLAVAVVRGDRMLARSTLGIFALFAAKVVVLDLEGADPLVRVGILVVLGAALYGGGWIYRRVLPPGASAAGGPRGISGARTGGSPSGR